MKASHDGCERTIDDMRGKPLLVAAATFLIVLIGGVAVAGVGTFSAGTTGSDPGTDPVLAIPDPDLPEESAAASTTTTTAPTTTAAVSDAADEENPATNAAVEAATDEKESEDADPKDESEDVDELFTITKPTDGSTITSKTVTFGGEVADGTVVTRGKFTADQADGTWTLTLVLSPGKNRVGFTAIGPDGAVQERHITVYYDAPTDQTDEKDHKDQKDDQHEKKKEQPAEYTFTAKQKYGSCGENVPYDVFYGKAAPGSTITVSSPHGSGSTTVGESGHWELKVKFPNAPASETFTVTVSASTGESKTFTFVNTTGHHGKDH